jgi:hypothetical protein
MHLYADGDHAFSFEKQKMWGSFQQWKTDVLLWMQTLGLAERLDKIK